MKEFKSKYFKLEEFIVSQTAIRLNIDNTPSDVVINNLNWLCLKILDPLREKLNKPIIISSGYRSEKLNKIIGGSKTSQHISGKAADIIVSGIKSRDLFNFIKQKTTLPFDQMIEEFSQWIHISHDRDKTQQQKERLIATKVNGKIIYEKDKD